MRTVYEQARRDPVLFNAVVLRDEATGKPIHMAGLHEAWHELLDRHDRFILWSAVEQGKCLGLGTMVLRHDGTSVRVEDVRVGDDLLGPDSLPRRVLSTATGVGPMYRIVPRKGEPWTCNGPHVLTLVRSGDRPGCNVPFDVPLDEYLRRTAAWKADCKLFMPGPVDFLPSSAQVPVDPYFLGIWLGDGTKDLRSVRVTKPDAEIEAACRDEATRWGLQLSVCVDSRSGCPTYGLASASAGTHNPLAAAMRALMPDGPRVPPAYLYGSQQVRAAVLAGLLDTDGYCVSSGCVEITQKDSRIADDVEFLARSLGLRVTRRIKIVGGSPYHRLFLSGEFGGVPMRIARKVPPPRTGGKDSRRVGFRVEALGDGPYAGFTLDGDGRFLLGDFTVTHNTAQIGCGRVLYEIGRDPSLRCAILCNVHDQALKLTKLLSTYITMSEELREVFPGLRRARDGGVWTQSKLTVERPVLSKDPTIQALGVHGNITGARLDLVVCDDILDFENTYTDEARKKLIAWYESTITGRLTERARVWFVGNAYHPEDLLHHLAKKSSWEAVRYPVVDDSGVPYWPERWSLKRIEERRQEMHPAEFARQMMCVSRSDEASIFKREWVERAMKRGEGRSLAYGLETIPPGYRTVTGVDLAVQQKDGADFTVLFSIIVHPDETREVLWIDAGRWSGPEIVRRVVDHHTRYGSLIFVENNGAQDFLLQFARYRSAVPIRAFTTGRNKAHPEFGIQGLATEMFNGKWIVPNDGGKLDKDVAAWVGEMLHYDPRAHTGDRLMACLAPGQDVTTERGLVPIQDVKVGDRVLTHRSRWRTVTGLSRRHWVGSAVAIKGRGMRQLLVTPEHPIWSAEPAHDYQSRTNRLVPKDGTWEFRDAATLRAGRKLAGDFLLAPAASWELRAPDVDTDLAFLAGLFLAEGSVGDHQVSFAFHRREQYLADFVRKQAGRLWNASTGEYRREGHGGFEAYVNSKRAADYFLRFGKRDTKALPWDWMALPTDIGLQVVRGWLVGDGSISESARGVRHLRGVSISRNLLYQMRQFLWRAGLVSTVCPFAQQDTFRGVPCGHLPAQQLSLSETDTASLLTAPRAEELERWGTGWQARQRTNSGSLAYPGGAAVRVAATSRFMYDDIVYNLHVEEDESFVAEGVAVHNSWFAREGARAGSLKVEQGTVNLLRR